jgi:hypothetical protein
LTPPLLLPFPPSAEELVVLLITILLSASLDNVIPFPYLNLTVLLLAVTLVEANVIVATPLATASLKV